MSCQVTQAPNRFSARGPKRSPNPSVGSMAQRKVRCQYNPISILLYLRTLGCPGATIGSMSWGLTPLCRFSLIGGSRWPSTISLLERLACNHEPPQLIKSPRLSSGRSVSISACSNESTTKPIYSHPNSDNLESHTRR